MYVLGARFTRHTSVLPSWDFSILHSYSSSSRICFTSGKVNFTFVLPWPKAVPGTVARQAQTSTPSIFFIFGSPHGSGAYAGWLRSKPTKGSLLGILFSHERKAATSLFFSQSLFRAYRSLTRRGGIIPLDRFPTS